MQPLQISRDVLRRGLSEARSVAVAVLQAAHCDKVLVEERSQHLEALAAHPIGACYYWVRKLQACVYAGDGASGIVAASKVASLLCTGRS